MSKRFDWDDLRVFVVTMRTGSLRKAAGTLGVSRQTAARRLSSLENQLGVRLFERGTDGLHATAAAVELLSPAEHAEQAMRTVARRAEALDSHLRGPIRVTVPAAVAAELLMPALTAFTMKWPHIELHLSGSYRVEQLAETADVAIRFVPHGTPPKGDLVGRRVATVAMSAYGEGENWIGQHGLGRDAGWIADSPFPEAPVRNAIFDGVMLMGACKAGMGMALLPCFMGDGVLRRRSDPKTGLDVWVVVHADMRRNPRFRVFRDAMVEALTAQAPRLAGGA